jgi:aspartate carbamoyltransferase catalytic subunit
MPPAGVAARRHLLGIAGLDRPAIDGILDRADGLLADPSAHRRALAGRTVVNAFFEPSTRTRTSFELAAKRLGAEVVSFEASGSSLSKGETLLDTCRTLDAMGPDAVVLRHAASGAAEFVAHRVGFQVINAGDGAHEHPTQALLDAFTLRRALGRLERLVVVICGDVAHSRVARSNAHLLRRYGAEVRVVGPRTLMPPAAEEALGVRVFHELEEALRGADAVMALRIQHERMEPHLLPGDRDYARAYGLTEARLAAAAPEALVMHPGPLNRGVEIDSGLADSPRSLILDQVTAGLAVRSAVLVELLGEAS